MTGAASWPGIAKPKTRVALITEVDFWLIGAGHRTRIQALVDTHDVASQRDADFLQLGHQPAWQTIDAAQERRRLAVFDRVLAICQPDADVFAAWLGAGRVLLVPHAMAENGQVLRAVAARILFVGSAYLPNLIGLRWFPEFVWPRAAAAGLTLDVVGAAGLMLAKPYPHAVQVHGVVADLEQAYAAADICINPVRFGSGLKIKTVEALAYGRPLLTTAHGMRGLQAFEGRAFLVADTADEFAATLLDLASRPPERARLAGEALRLIRADFSDEACYGLLPAELAALVEKA